jgi:hypothetical protein
LSNGITRSSRRAADLVLRRLIVNISGTPFRVQEPTVAQWLACADMVDADRTMHLVSSCVFDPETGAPAFENRAAIESAPISVVMRLDSELATLMECEIENPI